MKLACLCPTYGMPILLQNALAQYHAQTYPVHLRKLFILDDAGQFTGVKPWNGEAIDLAVSLSKFPTLPLKYAFLVARALLDWEADAFVVWDTDDIFLPTHLENHAAVLENHGWSHPRSIYSLYTGSIAEEETGGRFHSALALRVEYAKRIGYWGDSLNGRCSYDQDIMNRLRAISAPGQSDLPPTYVYRWGSTGCDHCSARSKSYDDRSWYTDTPISQTAPADGILRPAFDAETIRIYDQLASGSRDSNPVMRMI